MSDQTMKTTPDDKVFEANETYLEQQNSNYTSSAWPNELEEAR